MHAHIQYYYDVLATQMQCFDDNDKFIPSYSIQASTHTQESNQQARTSQYRHDIIPYTKLLLILSSIN